MKFEIHYEVNGCEDMYILEGDTVEQIQELDSVQRAKRGLTQEKNNMYSVKIGG